MKRLLTVCSVLLGLSGCVPSYTPVKPAPIKVSKDSMLVSPMQAWNKVPPNANGLPGEENWTQNGVMLDAIVFIGDVKDGGSISRQRAKDANKVPTFNADMTPQDLVSMVESFYRIRTGVTIFEITSVKPTTFLGTSGLQLNYDYVGGDEVRRRGRCVLSIVDKKLYLMTLDATAMHYFDVALPQFEAIASSARIP